MAWTELKSSGRYAGRYLDIDGKKRSAGTYVSEAEAMEAATRAEKASLPPVEERETAELPLSYYFYEEWLPAAQIEVRTKTDYESTFRNYIEPFMGSSLIEDVTAKEIRALVKAHYERPYVAHRIKSTLGSIFRTLVEEDVVSTNPTRGVRVPKLDKPVFTPLTPEDFKRIVEHLPTEGTRLFAKFLVGSGLRFSEASGLYLSDFNPQTNEIVVRRRATRVGKKDTPDGSRILVQESTKSKNSRVVPLSSALAGELTAFVAAYQIDRILFPEDAVFPHLPPKAGTAWASGNRRYVHGTEYSYTSGGCRCELCRSAVAYAKYRRTRHNKAPAKHLLWDKWNRAWRQAVKDAGLSWNPRTHDIRHAHATVLVASGVDIYEVQRRLGHASISTTEIYLHRVRDMMNKAAEASDVFL